MTESASGLSQPPAGLGAPDWATRLGHAGLLPFVAGALLVWLVHDEVRPWVEHALALYGALIVSFLGGIHWGVALRQTQPDLRLLGWGVVPSLVAWLAMLMPANAGLVVFGLALLGCYLVDRRLYPLQGVAHWLTLRFRLSAVAAACCFVGAAGS
jgi:hypothetical protein